MSRTGPKSERGQNEGGSSVTLSYGLPGLAMVSGIEDNVLVHVQGFIGETDGVFLGHDRG